MSRASGDPRLGRVIARWRLTEAERRAAVDVLEPEPRPGGPRLGPLSMDGAAATLVVAGGALAWATGAEGDLGGLGALALLGGVSLALARLLAVLTGRRRRRRLLAGPLEVLVGTDGVERFGEVARPWRGPGVRLEGAAPAEVGGLLFLEIEHSFLSGRGSTQGQRLRAKTLVPVPAGQAADAGDAAAALQRAAGKGDGTREEGR
jgi:hypothetical protein